MQEDILQFTHLQMQTHWELGTVMILMGTQDGAGTGYIMIRKKQREVVFQYCDNGITPHNVELMRRKSKFGASDGQVRWPPYIAATNAPESVKQMVLDPKEYAMLGGSFRSAWKKSALWQPCKEVSGMGQVSDHDVIEMHQQIFAYR